MVHAQRAIAHEPCAAYGFSSSPSATELFPPRFRPELLCYVGVSEIMALEDAASGYVAYTSEKLLEEKDQLWDGAPILP